MDIDEKKELVWGDITLEDLLRSLYRNKNFDEMSDKEIDRMLEDLI